MDTLLHFAEWCRSERELLIKQREALIAGKFKISENRGNGWVDTTSENLSRVIENISELNSFLADYEMGRSNA